MISIIVRKYSSIYAMIALLSACTVPAVSPVSQLEKSLIPTKNTQMIVKINERIYYEYLCDNKQIVRVQYDNTKKNRAVDITFQQSTHTLYSSVTKKSKKYSNIRWIWSEDFDGKGTLRDNRNKILAENCVKQ